MHWEENTQYCTYKEEEGERKTRGEKRGSDWTATATPDWPLQGEHQEVFVTQHSYRKEGMRNYTFFSVCLTGNRGCFSDRNVQTFIIELNRRPAR